MNRPSGMTRLSARRSRRARRAPRPRWRRRRSPISPSATGSTQRRLPARIRRTFSAGADQPVGGHCCGSRPLAPSDRPVARRRARPAGRSTQLQVVQPAAARGDPCLDRHPERTTASPCSSGAYPFMVSSGLPDRVAGSSAAAADRSLVPSHAAISAALRSPPPSARASRALASCTAISASAASSMETQKPAGEAIAPFLLLPEGQPPR